MTEREAWEFLAEAFSDARRYRLSADDELVYRVRVRHEPIAGHSCLCDSIRCLYMNYKISDAVLRRMRNKVWRARPYRALEGGLFYWSRKSSAGKRSRVLFCRKMAKLCARKRGKR